MHYKALCLRFLGGGWCVITMGQPNEYSFWGFLGFTPKIDILTGGLPSFQVAFYVPHVLRTMIICFLRVTSPMRYGKTYLDGKAYTSRLAAGKKKWIGWYLLHLEILQPTYCLYSKNGIGKQCASYLYGMKGITDYSEVRLWLLLIAMVVSMIIQEVYYTGGLRPKLAKKLDHLNYYPV